MSRKANTAIWLSVVSLVVAMVITAGVVFAWMASNITARGRGVGIHVMDDPNGGINLESVNGRSPDKSYTLYAGDVLDVGIRTTKAVDGFSVKLNFEKRLDKWEDFAKEAWRNDLLSGQYRYLEKEGFIEMDFDIDGYLQNYFSSGNYPELHIDGDSDKLREALIFEAKLRFLKYFSDNSNLLDRMTLSVISIGGAACDIELSEVIDGGDDDKDDSVKTFATDNPALSGIPVDTQIVVRLTFTNDFGIMMTVAEGEKMILDSGGDVEYYAEFYPGIYRALNYNCYTFQQINVNIISG